MNREQVIELFKFLNNIYPMFEVSSDKVDTWSRMMRKMDFERVMVRAEKHVSENKFPPTIAEISAFAPEENNHLDKISKWKKEASEVPESKKREFQQKMLTLMKEKRHEL